MSIVPGSDCSSDSRDQLHIAKPTDETSEQQRQQQQDQPKPPAGQSTNAAAATTAQPTAATEASSGSASASSGTTHAAAPSGASVNAGVEPLKQTGAPVQQSSQAGSAIAQGSVGADGQVVASAPASTDPAPTPKGFKGRRPRQTGSAAKPKQKRRANQSGAKNADSVHTGPSTAGGTIGAASDHAVPAMLSAGGGGRKPLPELVLPFKLPCASVKPELPLLDNATEDEKQAYWKASKLNDGSKQATQVAQKPAARKASPTKGMRSRSRQITGTGEEVSESEVEPFSSESDSDEDEDEKQQRRDERKRKREPASIEDSLVMLQSLRQSRLSHLSSLLPPFSQKVRSGMVYPNILPLSLLHGLNPREPHVLIQLGRADIQVGPHVFIKTKFWEVRPNFETSGSSTSSKLGGITSGPFGETKCSQRLEAKQVYSQPAVEQPKASANAATAQAAVRPATSTPQPIPPRPTAAATAAQPTSKTPQTPAQTTRPVLAALTQAPSTSTTFTQVSLPRPPIAQPTTSTTPSLPRPPTLTQGTQQGASSTTVSQHVQFAPARLSPISQSSQQQGAPGSTSTSPPRPIQPIPATSSAVTPSAPAPAGASTTGPFASAITPAASTVKPVPSPRQLQPTPIQARPPAQPAIDAVLVSRVNATAALNPELQQLLHVAASGKANPEQLKSLGVWIQAITAQLREDEAKAAAAGHAKDSQGQKGDATGSRSPDKPKKGRKKTDPDTKAARKAAKAEEKEAKKKAAAVAKAEAKGFFSSQRQPGVRPHGPPPGWPTDGPPRPPIIVVEFRENPSMRFILPLWKCVAERKEGVDPASMPKIKKEKGFFDDFDFGDDHEEEEKGVEPVLKLSFFVPAIGSDAAGRSGIQEILDEEQRKAHEEAKKKADDEAKKQPQATPAATGVAPSTSAATPTAGAVDAGAPGQNGDPATGPSLLDSPATDQKKLSKKAQKALEEEAKAQAEVEDANQPKKHEQFPATWTIKGGMTESMWEAFGRIPGCITNAVVRPLKVEPDIELAPDVAEFLVPEIKYHLLDQSEEELKIHKETASTFVDLFNQLPDRHYVIPCIVPMQIPMGLEEYLADKFTVRPQAVSARPVAKRKAGGNRDDGDFSFGFDGMGIKPGDVNGEAKDTPPKPPKRKRHVATHNPDGSIKSCGACGKTKTPMWRRGPKGPSQLCNACGARWKAGRLVVPEVAPPPIIETEADRLKEKEKQAKQAAHAAANGNGNSFNDADSGGNGLTSTAGAVFIPMTPSNGAMSMPSNTFGSMDISQSPSPFNSQAHTSLPMSSAGSYHLVGMDNGGMDFGSMSMGMSKMDHGHIPGSTQPSPSPFIRSPNPHEGSESMPASVDPSVLFGGSNSSRSSSH